MMCFLPCEMPCYVFAEQWIRKSICTKAADKTSQLADPVTTGGWSSQQDRNTCLTAKITRTISLHSADNMPVLYKVHLFQIQVPYIWSHWRMKGGSAPSALTPFPRLRTPSSTNARSIPDNNHNKRLQLWQPRGNEDTCRCCSVPNPGVITCGFLVPKNHNSETLTITLGVILRWTDKCIHAMYENRSLYHHTK